MRKLIPCALFLLVIFLCSCRKEHSAATTPQQKTYQVTFIASGSAQQINALNGKRQVNSLKTDALVGIAGYMDLLYYYVLDANNNVVHILKQDSTSTNFGTISDNLPSGTYTIIMVAGKKGLVYNTAQPTGESNSFLIYYDLIAGVSPWEDTFYDKFQLTVSGNVNQNVTLNRIVGELEVNVLDTIPANANSLVVTVQNEDYGLIIPDERPYYTLPLTDSVILAASAKGQPNYIVNNIIGNTYTPFTVNIKCYDASSKLLGNAIITSVTCQQNTKTILSGKLFGSGTGINIGLGNWNPPISGNF